MEVSATKSQMEQAMAEAKEKGVCGNLTKLTQMMINKQSLKVPVNTNNPRATLTYEALRNGMVKRYTNIIRKHPSKKEDPHYKLVFSLLGIDVNKVAQTVSTASE